MAMALDATVVVEPTVTVEPATPVVEFGVPEAEEPAVLAQVPLVEDMADLLI